MATPLTHVFLAGIDNSGPSHWQSIWRRRTDSSVWVEHSDWTNPNREAWVAELADCLSSIAGPKLVIAHSLGCLLFAAWARLHSDPGLNGAFLVAPPDPEAPSFPARATGWQKAESGALPCPAIVVASSNDPYASIDYARRLATGWGARLIDAGARGHLNAMSGLGDWPEGWSWLDEITVKSSAGEGSTFQ